MGLFSKKPPRTTALILDIENGSVGACLAELVPGHAPKLFNEARIPVPLMDTRSAATLMRAVEHAASDSLLRMSEIAARLRHHGKLAPVGKAALFLAAPWGVPNLHVGQPDFSEALVGSLMPRLETLFGAIPATTHAHASAAVRGLRALYPHEQDALLVSINGEVSELLLLKDGRVVGHATTPVGLGTMLRTLKSHAGLTEHEARSSLRLSRASEAHKAAAEHFVGEFRHTARDLLAEGASSSVFVLAQEPMGEWFGRSLAHPSLSELFPKGGTVRVVRNYHVAPFVAAGHAPDLHLSLNALYTSAAHR